MMAIFVKNFMQYFIFAEMPWRVLVLGNFCVVVVCNVDILHSLKILLCQVFLTRWCVGRAFQDSRSAVGPACGGQRQAGGEGGGREARRANQSTHARPTLRAQTAARGQGGNAAQARVSDHEGVCCFAVLQSVGFVAFPPWSPFALDRRASSRWFVWHVHNCITFC